MSKKNIKTSNPRTADEKKDWRAIATIIAAAIALIGTIFTAYLNNLQQFKETINSTPTAQTSCEGKPLSSLNKFFIYQNYHPSGYMGDTGDIIMMENNDPFRFDYEVCGRGPHEWDYKYVDGELNPFPAKFAGVMCLSPPNNWGTVRGGYDLRGFKSIHWEARSLHGEIDVEFIIGGVTWTIKKDGKEDAPYPDTMSRTSLGTYTLTEDWQEYQVDLFEHPDDDFQCVVGGFSWVISWGSNVFLENPGTCPDQPTIYSIEIRDIYYER